ncbi:MAG TPA: hypothetical protein VFL59_12490 [Candidatus Nanopelagicales bacterium]|nr:hypothetical protein [Candidatus Nanopelagicales bacterium]
MNERTTGGVMADVELEGYVDAVTARLGAIPDRDETVEELRAHLEEVRAEHTGVALRDLLGEPAAYADELRAAVGLPPYAPERHGFSAWIASVGAGIRGHAPRFLMDLRAFWWGFRGIGLGLMVYVLWYSVPIAFSYNEYFGLWRYLLSSQNAVDTVVRYWGWADHLALLTVLVVLGILVSIWVGGVLARGAGPRWLASLVGVVGVLLGLYVATVLWAFFNEGVASLVMQGWQAQGVQG